MDTKEIVKQLINDGAKEVSGLIVKNVTVTPMNEYVRLGITLNKPVRAYVANKDKKYEEGESDVIFISTYSISSLLKDDDNAAFAANHLVDHPKTMAMILSRANIKILQEDVEEGTPYKNPFASDDATTKVFDHNTIVNHIIDINLSDFGKERLNRLADLMLEAD